MTEPAGSLNEEDSVNPHHLNLVEHLTEEGEKYFVLIGRVGGGNWRNQLRDIDFWDARWTASFPPEVTKKAEVMPSVVLPSHTGVDLAGADLYGHLSIHRAVEL